MLNVRGLGSYLLLVAGSIALATVIGARQPPPSEREAMYDRYLEFASYVKGGSITPHWMADGSSFWYAEGTPSNTLIWKVDPKTNIKTTFLGSDSAAAREHERARPRIVGRGFDGDILEVLSPDGRWFAGTKDHNLWLRPAEGGPSLQLTEDGVADYAWDVEEAVWSADSKRIVASKIDGRGVAKIPLVDWLGVTEKVESVQPHRPTSGGPLRRNELHVFDISSRQRVRIDTGAEDQYIYTAGWRRDGSELMVLQMSRNFKRLNLLAADPATGSIRVVLTETDKTFLWGNVFNYRGWREQGGLFTMLDDGERFIWMSERDGWSHLYLYDFQGRRLRQLTRGSWPVERLVAVDEKRGWVYFTAHGDPKRPYDTQVYRAGLEREAFEPLASAPGRHNPVFSPSREFFLDTHSSLDRAPAVDLRRADGTLLQTLTRADIEGLKALRWAPPEEFTAKAADGSTDLYGVIHKPFDFNPKRKYPVLEFIYAGPQTTHVPRTFDGSSFALTQLGFIVVMLDARGTPERGKAFQDVVYGNLGRHEIPDHVAALKQIAKRRPYMDMTRVGVVGRSYGGYFTIRAMLLAPDLYRVGVASASAVEVYGHSSRVEPYLGLPSEDPSAYEYASNLRLAGNLEGKLLMIHGTADINAPFSQTMKMSDALIRANKPFDLLVLPGVGHFPAGEAERYWNGAVRRYLEEHLKPGLTVHRKTPPSPQGRLTETVLQPPQLQSDFALFRKALEEAHPALYRHTTKRDMDREFARAQAKLTRPMTLLQFRNVMAPIVAAIKDGHTGFRNYQGDEISTLLASAQQFPLALKFESTRAFVVLNQGLDERVKPGMEVLAINGQSLAEILQRILPNLPQDGDIRTGQLHKLGFSEGPGSPGRTGFSESYRLYIGDSASFRTTLRDPQTQKTVVVALPGVTNAETTANAEKNPVNRDVLNGIRTLEAVGKKQSIRYLDGENTALMRIPGFPNGESFPDFLKAAFAGLKSKGTKNLIVDLRGNNGGFDVYPGLLFSYLTSREFRSNEPSYIKTFQPSFRQYTNFPAIDPLTDPYYGSAAGIWKAAPNGGWLMTEKYPIVGVRKPSENHFDGAVYVLIDGGTVSAASAFSAMTDRYKRAIFIGEETGGAGGGAGGDNIGPTLPASHLHLAIPIEAEFSIIAGNRRRGTLPAYAVTQTIDDLAKGRDTVLEFTRELIRSLRGH